MTTWHVFEEQAPQLAEVVRARLEAAETHVLASLRRDGSPRVSGTEVFWHDQDLLIGSMDGAVKAGDLLRDPRFALHAHPASDGGDAKLSGRALTIVDPEELRAITGQVEPPGPARFFRLDLAEAVTTEVGDDQQHLLIKRWRPDDGVAAFTRYH